MNWTGTRRKEKRSFFSFGVAAAPFPLFPELLLSLFYLAILVVPSHLFQSTIEHGSLHIVMLPWLAFGRLLPFFELSKSLARQGHRISFLTTPRNVERLPTIPSRVTHLITFIELSLPQIENLPENAEATIDLPSDYLRPYLSKTFDTLEQKLSDLIQSKQISFLDCIVYNQPSGGVTSCTKLEGMVVWISVSLTSAFFASLECFSCINLIMIDHDDGIVDKSKEGLLMLSVQNSSMP